MICFTKTEGQSGQAATEFLITAVFILVPLFLIIPLLGKYIDVRHATVQQARFEAWEYTTWMGPDESDLTGRDHDLSAGRRDYATTRQRAASYFLADPHAPGYGTVQAEPPLNNLWKDHRGQWLFAAEDQRLSGPQSEGDAPDPTGGVANSIFSTFNDVYATFGSLLRALGQDATFDAVNTRGFFTSQVEIPLRHPYAVLPQLPGFDGEDPAELLVVKAKSGVQGNCWNAAGKDTAHSQSKGLVFTTLLEPATSGVNTILNWLQKGLDVATSIIPLIEIKFTVPHLPDFGHMKKDLVPYEHLEAVSQDGTAPATLPTLHDESGLYYYEEEEG